MLKVHVLTCSDVLLKSCGRKKHFLNLKCVVSYVYKQDEFGFHCALMWFFHSMMFKSDCYRLVLMMMILKKMNQ